MTMLKKHPEASGRELEKLTGIPQNDLQAAKRRRIEGLNAF